MRFFGEHYPRERQSRLETLEPYDMEDPDQNPFEALDDRFFELVDAENGGFESAADRYAVELD
jgi:hypothetical protein